MDVDAAESVRFRDTAPPEEAAPDERLSVCATDGWTPCITMRATVIANGSRLDKCSPLRSGGPPPPPENNNDLGFLERAF